MNTINAITRRLGAVPPDPDGLNGNRGDSAKTTLTIFCQRYPTDWEDGLADLLSNLMHMCDRLPDNLKLDFEEEFARARRMYKSETTPE